jgi:hypothetical protein
MSGTAQPTPDFSGASIASGSGAETVNVSECIGKITGDLRLAVILRQNAGHDRAPYAMDIRIFRPVHDCLPGRMQR